VVDKERNIKLLENMPVTNSAECVSRDVQTLGSLNLQLPSVDCKHPTSRIGPYNPLLRWMSCFTAVKDVPSLTGWTSQWRRGVFCEVGIEFLNLTLSNFSHQRVATEQFLISLVAIGKLLSRME
jgi:hypothetical protein